MQITPKTSNFTCETCFINKAKAKPISTKPAAKNLILFAKIHSDLCGAFVQALDGGCYFIFFINNKSHYCWLYFINYKSNLPGAFFSFLNVIKTQFGVTVQVLHSDREGEYTSFAIQKILSTHETLNTYTTPHSLQFNGIAKRRGGILVLMARTMLANSGLPQTFWKNTIIYCNTLTNCSSSEATGLTFYEILFGKKSDVFHFHCFGCRAVALIQDYHLTKLKPRAQNFIYIGSSFDSFGHCLWNPETKRITVNWNVTFFDNVILLISKANTKSLYFEIYTDKNNDDNDFPLSIQVLITPSIEANLPSLIVPTENDSAVDISAINLNFVTSSDTNPIAGISTMNTVIPPNTGFDVAPNIIFDSG